jgi:hypothetical protein
MVGWCETTGFRTSLRYIFDHTVWADYIKVSNVTKEE